jgi:Tfp pilus assembly protein PilX
MKNIHSQRGSVLIFALIFAVIICGLCGGYLQTASTEWRLARRSFNYGRAMALAEAGVEMAIWRCNSGSTGNSDGWTISADGNSLWRIYTSVDLASLASMGGGSSGKIYLRIDNISSDSPSIISMGKVTDQTGEVTKQIKVSLTKNTTT